MISRVVALLATFGYASPPLAMKSLMASVYVAVFKKLTGAPVQLPSAACRTALTTRSPLPGTGVGLTVFGVREMSYVKQSPAT
jgi:hypothetical protein